MTVSTSVIQRDLGQLSPRVEAEVAERLRPWAQQRGHSLAELGIAWLLAYPEVSSVIVGARRIDQVEATLQALTRTLSADERDEAERLARGEA